MDHQAGQHLGADRMELELERRDDAEVAAAAPDAPRTGRGSRARSPGRSRPSAVTTSAETQVVDREAQAAAQPAEAAAERQARDAGGRVDAERHGQAVAPGWSRSTSPSVAPAPTRAVRAAWSTRTVRIGERSIISPPSQTALPAMLCPPPRTATSRSCARANRTARRDVVRVGALHDEAGPPVDHRVPDRARLVVAGRVWGQERAAEAGQVLAGIRVNHGGRAAGRAKRDHHLSDLRE